MSSRPTANPAVFLLNGPNLNLLGDREPHIYGSQTLADIETQALNHAAKQGLALHTFQSNHEGELVDLIQRAHSEHAAAIIINAGAYSHTSIALRDALAACSHALIVEVHLSALAQREPFRHCSYIAQVAHGAISGFGADGYLLAIDAVARRLHSNSAPETV